MHSVLSLSFEIIKRYGFLKEFLFTPACMALLIYNHFPQVLHSLTPELNSSWKISENQLAHSILQQLLTKKNEGFFRYTGKWLSITRFSCQQVIFQFLIRCNDRRLQWTESPKNMLSSRCTKYLSSLCACLNTTFRESPIFVSCFLPWTNSPAIINEPVKWKIITKNVETAGVSFNCFYDFTSKCFNTQNYTQTQTL